MDSYWWLCFRSPQNSLEIDQDRLFELEATGIEEVEEQAASAEVLLKAFFETEPALAAAHAWFKDRRDLAHGEDKIEDWDRSWRDRQTPVAVTDSLVVMPPWVQAPADGRHVIRLEAKMAFGTGSHESTRIAATLLERLASNGSGAGGLSGGSVLDIGTGTGILAIYAAQLGAASVLALDIDPVVGPCLQENLILNPPPPACRFRTLIGEIDSLAREARFNVVICNMIRTELWPFREQLRNRLTAGAIARKGVFVVSGQRLEDKPHFLAWRETSPFRIVDETEMDGWWGFAASLQ